MSNKSPLGEPSIYPAEYAPEALYAIARADNRVVLGLTDTLPFSGFDVWNAWELTWLGAKGTPQVATAEIRIPADSPNIVESKSLKLYLNSLSMTTYASQAEVAATIKRDVSERTGKEVDVRLVEPRSTEGGETGMLAGECIDGADIACDTWEVNTNFLQIVGENSVSESLHSHLLRSLCPVTNRPDSGSVLIRYRGPRIERHGLLRYIVSFRQHNDFHESCVERMFVDILKRCRPLELTVYARYQRRGGIDINPFRSNFEDDPPNCRLWRQ